MDNQFDDAILEGFICPECKVTFGTAALLSYHFALDHGHIEDEAPVDNETFTRHFENTLNIPKSSSYAFYENSCEKQLPGNERSLTGEFELLRKTSVNKNSLETNNLLIRLEKLVTGPEVSSSERKTYEQTVVPWIDAKVDLCPSCGRNFGLAAESTYLDECDSIENIQANEPNISKPITWIRSRVTRLTNTILDYNPVYRRRHHCRLCGHVLCADCSHFLPISNAQKLLSLLNVDNVELFSSDYSSDKSESRDNSVDNILILFPGRSHPTSSESIKNEYELRVCFICKSVIERKFNRRRLTCGNSFISQMHTELKHLMNYVSASIPTYTTIAESLNSGEEKYALELAKSMHSELLTALQKIELIGRRFEKITDCAPDSVLKNRPLIRVGNAVSRQAKSFVQSNLPPLRTLPTVQQFGDLAAQRRDELASRWQEEDRALLQLARRVAQNHNNQITKSPQRKPKMWQNIFQSPTQSIDTTNHSTVVQRHHSTSQIEISKELNFN